MVSSEKYWTNTKYRHRDDAPADAERQIFTQFGTKFETFKITPVLNLSQSNATNSARTSLRPKDDQSP
jgi:hypothetical protein